VEKLDTARVQGRLQVCNWSEIINIINNNRLHIITQYDNDNKKLNTLLLNTKTQYTQQSRSANPYSMEQ